MPSLVEIGKEVQSEEKKLYKVVNVLLLTVYLPLSDNSDQNKVGL